MKIGILAGGNDMFPLFEVLCRHDHEYLIWYDDIFGPWGEKPLEVFLDRLEAGMQWLAKQGAEVFLLPPLGELLYAGKFSKQVVPVFSRYVVDGCLPHSLVGKLGFVGDVLDMQVGQEALAKLVAQYVPSDAQRAIKKFHWPVAWWGKEVGFWKYLLTRFAVSWPLAQVAVKHDVRYFKDAGVDTIIPLTYSAFAFAQAIKKIARGKTLKFHTLSIWERFFVAVVGAPSVYSCKVWYTGTGNLLLRNKRIMWLLGRGKGNVVCEKI